MLNGKRYRLNNPTLALDFAGEKPVAITIPGGDIIQVISVPGQERRPTVKVLWNSKTVQVFVVDIEIRGAELPEDHGAHA